MITQRDAWRDQVFLERVPPVADRQHYRLMHRQYVALVTCVSEAVRSAGSLFCHWCQGNECLHCTMARTLIAEDDVRDADVLCAYCSEPMAGDYGTTLDPEFDICNVLVHTACKREWDRLGGREAASDRLTAWMRP